MTASGPRKSKSGSKKQSRKGDGGTGSVEAFFTALGDDIERRWRAASYDEKVFPELATTALRDADCAAKVEPDDVVRWMFEAPHLPLQADVPGRFGQPPLTVYAGPRFHVDVYYWIDGTTSIHQHAFCGAFYVLRGSSIHSLFRFDDHEPVGAHFGTGSLASTQVELLAQGDARPILAGAPLIHSLFHLDRPSVTICARTYHSPDGAPQWDYMAPGLVRDPFFESASMFKRLQLVEMLVNTRSSELGSMVSALLEATDAQTAFAVLERVQHLAHHQRRGEAEGESRDRDQVETWLDIARKRHGELVDRFQAVFAERMRQQYISGRRSLVTAADHRYLLALLLNLRDREALLKLVHERYPQRDPIDQIVEWLDTLSTTRLEGSEENVLGLQGVDDDYLFVTEGLLAGRSMDQILADYAEDNSPEEAQRQEGRLREQHDAIKGSLLFRSILA